MADHHLQSPAETALITGGNGNLGRLVADRLLELGHAVVKFDVPGTHAGATRANETILDGDIRDSNALERILVEHRPSSIYHLASLLSGSSEADLGTAWEINATASFNLLDLAHRNDVSRFFFASTVGTYGPIDTDPMPLDEPQWPENFYGATKVAVERLGVYFKQRHGLDFRCLRLPLVLSPFAPEGAMSAYPSHAFKAAFEGRPFRFPVSADTGIATVFLEDVIDGICDFNAADAARLGQPVYNLGGYHLTAGAVATAVTKHFPDFDYSFEPDGTVEKFMSDAPDRIDDSAARDDWGWRAKFDLDRTAERICELLRAGGPT